MKRKPMLFQGLAVTGYRTDRVDMYFDGTWSDIYQCDFVSIEIDSAIHEEGLVLDKKELKAFIKLLKSNLRNARFKRVYGNEENNEGTS